MGIIYPLRSRMVANFRTPLLFRQRQTTTSHCYHSLNMKSPGSARSAPQKDRTRTLNAFSHDSVSDRGCAIHVMKSEISGARRNLKSLARWIANENNEQEIPTPRELIIPANAIPEFGPFLETRHAKLAGQTAILDHASDAAEDEAVPVYYGFDATGACIDAIRDTSNLTGTGGNCE
jgi:hypothetical protein